MKYLLLTLAVMAASTTYAQGTQFTYCQNGRGEVVIVSNFTCPAGYWPI